MSKRAGACLLALVAASLADGAAPSAQDGPWWKALPRPIYRELERVPVESRWFEVYRIGPS